MENFEIIRYGGHIELIRFKEYYRMPGGHEHISFGKYIQKQKGGGVL